MGGWAKRENHWVVVFSCIDHGDSSIFPSTSTLWNASQQVSPRGKATATPAYDCGELCSELRWVVTPPSKNVDADDAARCSELRYARSSDSGIEVCSQPLGTLGRRCRPTLTSVKHPHMPAGLQRQCSTFNSQSSHAASQLFASFLFLVSDVPSNTEAAKFADDLHGRVALAMIMIWCAVPLSCNTIHATNAAQATPHTGQLTLRMIQTLLRHEPRSARGSLTSVPCSLDRNHAYINTRWRGTVSLMGHLVRLLVVLHTRPNLVDVSGSSGLSYLKQYNAPLVRDRSRHVLASRFSL